MTYSFEHTSYDDNNNRSCYEATHDNENSGWPELTERFLEFLRGCGFTLSAQDFVDYVHERVAEYEEAIADEEPNECADCENNRNNYCDA